MSVNEKRIKAAAKGWKLPRKAYYFLVSVFSLSFMFCFSEVTGFWYDEFAQICFSGLNNSLLDSLKVIDPTPPLFNLAANIWYHIMPYGERWLLLLPQIAVGGAIYITGLWGERLFGHTTGLCGALLLGFSQMVIEQCGFEFRSYGFYLLFSIAALYIHSFRLESGKIKKGLSVWYSLILILLLYSHLFGSILAISLMVIEFLNIQPGKRRIKCLAPYLFAAAAFIPWLTYFLHEAGNYVAGTTVNWMVKPNLWEVVKLTAYLCGNHIVFCAFFLCGIIITIYRIVVMNGSRDAAIRKLTPIIAIIIMITIVYLYGILRYEYASLWVKRYFTGLFPCCAVLAAAGATELKEIVCKRIRNNWGALVPIVLIITTVPYFMYRTATANTTLGVYFHREAAELLFEQEDIMDEDTLVLSTLGETVDGWYTYYVERKESRNGYKAASIYSVNVEEMRRANVIYVDEGYVLEDCLAWGIIQDKFILDKEWPEINVERYVRKMP